MTLPPVTTSRHHRRIVVGVDGSALSLSALDWAQDLCTSDDELHVVTCGPSSTRARSEREWLDHRAMAQSSHHVLDRAAARGLTEFAVEIDADLLVVGAHGGSIVSPRVLGSVAHSLLRACPCPIAIVTESCAVSNDASVVVGVGDGPATRAAIDWAVGFAATEQRTIDLVRAVKLRPIFGVDRAEEVLAAYIDTGLLMDWAREEVDLVATEVTALGLEVTKNVTAGRAGRRIVDASKDARVVVVGKHFDGPITGYFTGVTLHHVLTHANCPVVVVAASETDDGSNAAAS